MLRRLAILAAACVAVGVAAAPASAAITTAFTLTPRNQLDTATVTQAGFPVRIETDADIGTADNDDIRKAKVVFAEGLLANPAAGTPCTTAEVGSDTCPDAEAKIGDGAITANVEFLGVQTVQLEQFLVEPDPADPTQIVRVGLLLDLTAFGLGKVPLFGAATLRTGDDPDTPGVTEGPGVNVTFDNIPNDLLPGSAGGAVTITEILLNIYPTINNVSLADPAAHILTRSPTYCGTATSSLVGFSYAAATTAVPASSSYTVTGCTALDFTPSFTAAANVAGAADDQLEVTTTIAQDLGEAGTETTAVTFPPSVQIRPSAAGRACAEATDADACPAVSKVGTATASAPFLPPGVTLTGDVILKNIGTSLPGVVVDFDDPFPLRLVGVAELATGFRLKNTFDDIPDIPISSLAVTLAADGPNSLLRPNYGAGICSGSPGSVLAEFVGQNTETATINAPLSVTGCPTGSVGAPPAPGGTPSLCPAGTSAGVSCSPRAGGGLTINGTAGNDTIVCTAGDDVVNAGAGDDVVNCGPGDDSVNGQQGNDTLNGEAGNDRLNGGPGNDRLNGGTGNDRLQGASGRDVINGGGGNDRITGGTGNDNAKGGRGRDSLAGNAGRDKLAGQGGNDRLNGGGGNDGLNGGSGNDSLKGGSGRDNLKGGPGRDRLVGGPGRDRLNGGPGRDRQRQ